MTDYRLVERVINERSIDTVFHLGAQAIVKKGRKAPYQTFESNIRGTYTLLDACRGHKDQVKRINKPYVYCNAIGYQEELVFDGQSFAMNSDGEIIAFGDAFNEDLLLIFLIRLLLVCSGSLRKTLHHVVLYYLLIQMNLNFHLKHQHQQIEHIFH